MREWWMKQVLILEHSMRLNVRVLILKDLKASLRSSLPEREREARISLHLNKKQKKPKTTMCLFKNVVE